MSYKYTDDELVERLRNLATMVPPVWDDICRQGAHMIEQSSRKKRQRRRHQRASEQMEAPSC